VDQDEDIRCHCGGSARADGHGHEEGHGEGHGEGHEERHGHESNVGTCGVHHDEVHSRETWSGDNASDPDQGDPGLLTVAIQKENKLK
jgi:hypothetical protein